MDNRNIFIRGRKILLVALEEKDVIESNWYGWFNDEETSTHLQKHYYPNTIEKQLNFFNASKSDNTKVLLGITAIKKPETLIGIASIQAINYMNRTAELSMVIGEKDSRGLIFAEETMRLLLDHAFKTLNLNKIHLGYLETLKAWGTFIQKRFGFKVEGELIEHVYKNGKYVNVELLGLLKRNYINNKQHE